MICLSLIVRLRILLWVMARVDTFESLVDFVAVLIETRKASSNLRGHGVGNPSCYNSRLSETKKVATTIIHYPSFTIDVKNGIKDSSGQGTNRRCQTSEVFGS